MSVGGELFYICEAIGVTGDGKYIISDKQRVNDGQKVLMGENYVYDYEDDRGNLYAVHIRSIGKINTTFLFISTICTLYEIPNSKQIRKF